jgi:hypothetical protein
MSVHFTPRTFRFDGPFEPSDYADPVDLLPNTFRRHVLVVLAWHMTGRTDG